MNRHLLRPVMMCLFLVTVLSCGYATQLLWAGGSAGLTSHANSVAQASPSHLPGNVSRHDSWRRTSTGWERLEDFEIRASAPCDPWCNITQLHPAIVTALITLISVGALVGTSSDRVVTRREISSLANSVR